jgi:(2S)-methylsuccinyl-CoA dehydrogenase
LATALSAIRPEAGACVDLWATTRAALDATDALFLAAKDAVRRVVAPAGRIDAALLDREQFAAHGLAWLEVYRQALRQMRGWAERLDAEGALGERERLMLEAAFGEYLARIRGGIPMSQVEIVRPHDLYLDEAAIRAFADDPAVQALIRDGNNAASRIRLATLIEAGDFGAWGLGDETLEMIREQFERFSDDKVIPFAHGWHERDELIPLALIEELASSASSASRCPRSMAASAWARWRCASSPRSCPAAISALARCRPARRSRAS